MNRCDCRAGKNCDRCDPRITRVEDREVFDAAAADDMADRYERDMWGAA